MDKFKAEYYKDIAFSIAKKSLPIYFNPDMPYYFEIKDNSVALKQVSFKNHGEGTVLAKVYTVEIIIIDLLTFVVKKCSPDDYDNLEVYTKDDDNIPPGVWVDDSEPPEWWVKAQG